MNVLRYVYPPNNRKCPKNFLFWGPHNDEVAWFSMSREPLVVQSWLTPQNTARMDLLWVFCDLHNPQTIGSAQKCLFWTLYIILKVLISRKLYIILNWLTFQNDRKTCLSISANKIYTSTTKENGLKWEFQFFFSWMRFSEFLLKLDLL